MVIPDDHDRIIRNIDAFCRRAKVQVNYRIVDEVKKSILAQKAGVEKKALEAQKRAEEELKGVDLEELQGMVEEIISLLNNQHRKDYAWETRLSVKLRGMQILLRQAKIEPLAIGSKQSAKEELVPA